MFGAATFCGQQDVGTAAVAQADHFPPAQNVHLFGDNGALAVPCAQTVTAVESEGVHLSVGRGGIKEGEHTPGIRDKRGSVAPVRRVGNRSHSKHTNINSSRQSCWCKSG